MGGVAGHAGLFSTAGDIAKFAQMMLNGGIYGYRPPASPRDDSGVHHAGEYRRFRPHSRLGRVRRSPLPPATISRRQASATPASPAPRSGSTPSADLFVILLTNRVNPTRANEKIRQVRPALHDAIFEAWALVRAAGIARRRPITSSAQALPESSRRRAILAAQPAIIEFRAGADLRHLKTEQRNPRSRGLDRKSTRRNSARPEP